MKSPIINKVTTQLIAKNGALNLNVIAVLNGSIELADSPKSKEYIKVPARAISTIYFPNFNFLSKLALMYFCFILKFIAILFSNSCRAPNGPNQPQTFFVGIKFGKFH